MQIRHGLDQGKPKPRAFGRAAFLQTIKAAQHQIALPDRNSRPGIRNRRRHPIGLGPRPASDHRARRTMPDGVFDQVCEGLSQQFRVASDPCGTSHIAQQGLARVLCHFGINITDVSKQCCQIDRSEFLPTRPRLDLRYAKQRGKSLVDGLTLRDGGSEVILDRCRDGCVACRLLILNTQSVQRRAQFVGDVGADLTHRLNQSAKAA